MKRVKYKGWLLQWNSGEEAWDLYTPEKLERSKKIRHYDITLETIEEAKAWIDNY